MDYLLSLYKNKNLTNVLSLCIAVVNSQQPGYISQCNEHCITLSLGSANKLKLLFVCSCLVVDYF